MDPKTGLVRGFAAVGAVAVVVATVAFVLFSVVLSVYISLAGITAILASGSLFGASVTGTAVLVYIAALFVGVLFKAVVAASSDS